MPKPIITKVRLDNICSYLAPVAKIFVEMSDAFGTPFILAIANTTSSLITAVQTVKKNKDDCIQLLEKVYEILHAIINLYMATETPANLSPATLGNIGEFTETLHKIYTFVELQQEGNKIMHFLRQNKMAMLLNNCYAELQHAAEVFKIETGVSTLNNIVEMHKKSENIHKELLELISTMSDDTHSDSFSSIYPSASGALNRW
ncbi:hypothetical protein MVEN_01597900 [Mycena venus]|uniref:Uncharacterized protein n=1 Tax=Mycena venus TaxID=2733690 RepID=A0A8H6XQS0_9AGAR|nr:hypothetical protein MVEN_01597900 [Mycena venus]